MGRRYSVLCGWPVPCPPYPGPWTRGGWEGGQGGGGLVGLLGGRERKKDD